MALGDGKKGWERGKRRKRAGREGERVDSEQEGWADLKELGTDGRE